MNQTLIVKYLATQSYLETFNQLRNFTHTRDTNTNDELWLLEHHSVFTQGQAGKPEHILNSGTIPVVKSDRGGQVTYHGPGQLIVYLLVDLQRKQLSVRDFLDSIEQSVLDLLKTYNISANTDRNAPGIYVNGAKICSIGLRVRKGRTYHGISLNVAMDLEPFSRINPCGFQGLQMTQIRDYVHDISLTATIERLVPIFAKNLNYQRIQHDYN